MQPLYQLYRDIDYLLTEARQGECAEDQRETINHFWNMVDKNPSILPEMRKTHGAILERAVNGAMWESQIGDEKKRTKTFTSNLRINLKSPIHLENFLLNDYIQLKAQLINSTFFKAVVSAEVGYGKPPYTPYESLLARLWGLPNPQPPATDDQIVMQNLQEAEKSLQRFLKQYNQPDNII